MAYKKFAASNVTATQAEDKSTGGQGVIVKRSPQGTYVPSLHQGQNVKPMQGGRLNGPVHDVAYFLCTTNPPGAVMVANPGDNAGVQPAKFYVYTPSSRLRCGISVYWELAEFAGGYHPLPTEIIIPRQEPAPVLKVEAFDVDPNSGNRIFLGQAYPSSGYANVSDSYEFDSASPLAVVTINQINDNCIDTTVSPWYDAAIWGASQPYPPGYVFLRCRASWEANVEMPRRELEDLFRQCRSELSYDLTPDKNTFLSASI